MFQYSSPFIRFPLVVTLVILVASCVSRKEKKPIFISSIDAVEYSIRRTIGFQEITFHGIEQSARNETSTLLTVEIIDPPISVTFETIPEEDSALREIGRQVMLDIKRNLKDSMQYQLYAIKFTHKDHNWRNSSTTRSYLYYSRSQ